MNSWTNSSAVFSHRKREACPPSSLTSTLAIIASDMWLNIAFVITIPYGVDTNKSYGVRADGEESNHGGNCNMWLKSVCWEKVFFFFFTFSQTNSRQCRWGGFLKFYNS